MAVHQFTSSGYRLPLSIEQVEDGMYMATSSALEGFLVLADSIEEIFQLAPGVAKALIESMHEKGIEPATRGRDLPPGTLRAILRQLGISPDEFYSRKSKNE